MSLRGHKIIEYTVLVIGILVFILLLWVYRGSRPLEILTTGLGALFYFLWGIVHHKLEDRLTLSIATEYLLISLFVFLLVLTVLGV